MGFFLIQFEIFTRRKVKKEAIVLIIIGTIGLD